MELLLKQSSSYLFWLVLISASCFTLEFFFPWRKEQKQIRKEFWQDVFFLFFNGLVFGAAFYGLLDELHLIFTKFSGISLTPKDNLWQPFAHVPWWGQLLIILILKDFLEYLIHYQLHRRRWLWSFHQLHHSITTMDWIGNFRFHWMEIIVYDLGKWLPLMFLQADYRIYLTVAVFSTAVGHLNHSNLNISWGPLRYIFNSPRMHIWHHDYKFHKPAGCNFAVVFSLWDWLFKTAYFPQDIHNPEKLAFKGVEKYPHSLLKRLSYPLCKILTK